MKAISSDISSAIPLVIFNVFAVAFIFLLPAISHLIGFAIYQLDPMRIALFSAILITNRKNTYFIALLLPIVSFIISAHPYFYKVFLISSELLLNVWLFYFLGAKIKNLFLATLSSILISKCVYYLLKFMMIRFLLINDSLVSTSLIIQGVMVLVFSIAITLFSKKGSN